MEKRKVSIILPTYNRAYIIKNSIRSILDQTYKDYELIIVDDGSTDETENVINEINDDRIFIINLLQIQEYVRQEIME